MKHFSLIQFLTIGVLTGVVSFSTSAKAGATSKAEDDSGPSKLVYADFHNPVDGRPVSKNGGQTRLNRYAANYGSCTQDAWIGERGPAHAGTGLGE